MLVESKVRADRAISIAESIAAQHLHRLMSVWDAGGQESVVVINPTNVPRSSELVVVWLRVNNDVEVEPGASVAIYDQTSPRKPFLATVLSSARSWDYRHQPARFREAVQLKLLKVALFDYRRK